MGHCLLGSGNFCERSMAPRWFDSIAISITWPACVATSFSVLLSKCITTPNFHSCATDIQSRHIIPSKLRRPWELSHSFGLWGHKNYLAMKCSPLDLRSPKRKRCWELSVCFHGNCGFSLWKGAINDRPILRNSSSTCMFNTYALFSNIWEKWYVGWIGYRSKSLTIRIEMTFAMIQ